MDLLEIQPEDKDRLSCLNCGSTKNLNMYAHRTDVMIVGFIIVCEGCFMVVAGRELKVELYERAEA